MNADGKFAKALASGTFIVTAEYRPKAVSDGRTVEEDVKGFGKGLTAVNVSDNCHAVGLSSIAASVAMLKSGVEPICHMVTRDRNRIAIQSDLLGAASLGIRNLLCLSGYHQTLTSFPASANVYDIDSIQFIELATKMSEKGLLADGTKIEGPFSMLVGAAANPFMTPMELNMLRTCKKVDAGAKFIQTNAIFDVENFGRWLEAAGREGISSKSAVLAGVLALDSAAEAQRLRKTYTDYSIPDEVVERLKKAGNEAAQGKEGLKICVETIQKLKSMKGLKGLHIHCGQDGLPAPEIIAAAVA